jgi:hypothetical protein
MRAHPGTGRDDFFHRGKKSHDFFCLGGKILAVATDRYLRLPITGDLEHKVVFLAGPRQVGKTTLAKQILAAKGPGVYLSWDRSQDRREIREARWPGGEALIVLDELHKYRPWKRWLHPHGRKEGRSLRAELSHCPRRH